METWFTRRLFIGSCFASGAAACIPVRGFGSEKPIAVIGVVSDIHLRNPGDEACFKTALEYFRSRRVNGVLLPGDIADRGRFHQLKMAADAWFSVFPDGKMPDGRKVEQLFVYGNHDIDCWKWKWMHKNLPIPENPDVGPDVIGRTKESAAKAWEDCFREEYRPVWMKKVNGIPVIGAHWEDGYHFEIDAFMAVHGRELDSQLPFLYLQHAHPKDTCFGSWAWGSDDGASAKILSTYPNAVAFSGHSHYTLTDERSVWQGAFTSINTASLAGISHDYSCRENAAKMNKWGYQGEKRAHASKMVPTKDGRQGMVVSVFESHLVIERREFAYGHSLGEDWIVPVPARADGPLSYAQRAAGRSAPQFGPDAKVSVAHVGDKDGRKRIEVSFPAANAVDGCRVNEYEVTATLVEDDFDLVQAQRRVLAADFHLPAAKAGIGTSCAFFLDELPRKGHYRFSVRPIECFGKKGRMIVSDVFVV